MLLCRLLVPFGLLALRLGVSLFSFLPSSCILIVLLIRLALSTSPHSSQPGVQIISSSISVFSQPILFKSHFFPLKSFTRLFGLRFFSPSCCHVLIPCRVFYSTTICRPYLYHIGECVCVCLSVCVCILLGVYTSPSVVRSGPNLAHACRFI